MIGVVDAKYGVGGIPVNVVALPKTLGHLNQVACGQYYKTFFIRL